MFFKNRIAFIPPLAEAGVFCDDYDKRALRTAAALFS
jgi:hypothetical protein